MTIPESIPDFPPEAIALAVVLVMLIIVVLLIIIYDGRYKPPAMEKSICAYLLKHRGLKPHKGYSCYIKENCPFNAYNYRLLLRSMMNNEGKALPLLMRCNHHNKRLVLLYFIDNRKVQYKMLTYLNIANGYKWNLLEIRKLPRPHCSML